MRRALFLFAMAVIPFAALAADAAAEGPVSVSEWLEAAEAAPALGELRPILQGEGSSSADRFFKTPYPGKRYLEPPEVPVDWFVETWRLGVDSGLIFPLGAQKAQFHIGWWARVYGQVDMDAGLKLFRTAVEISFGVGQSQSSRSEQDFRITSNYMFLSVRGVADFLPHATADLFLYAGLGGGLEIASGHFIQSSGSVDETKRTNFNLLMETGGGYAFELSNGFYLQMRGSLTYPVGSPNITLFVQAELGVQFLFQ
jgi:hypothetical protein